MERTEVCWSDLLFALDDCESFSHQFLVHPAEVGHFLLALMMNVHAAFCAENKALPNFIMCDKNMTFENTVLKLLGLSEILF